MDACDLPLARTFPPDAGKILADHLLEVGAMREAEVDLTHLPGGLVVSAFFHGFLQRVHEREPSLLPYARAVRWVLAHSFQAENVVRFVRDFRPRRPQDEGEDASLDL